jgi:hypothetical protein
VIIIDPIIIILTVMGLSALMYLACIYHIHMSNQTKQLFIKQMSNQEPPPKEKPKTEAKGKVTPDEFMKVMDMMLVMGIIDMKEYNQLIAKSIPYL